MDKLFESLKVAMMCAAISAASFIVVAASLDCLASQLTEASESNK